MPAAMNTLSWNCSCHHQPKTALGSMEGRIITDRRTSLQVGHIKKITSGARFHNDTVVMGKVIIRTHMMPTAIPITNIATG